MWLTDLEFFQLGNLSLLATGQSTLNTQKKSTVMNGGPDGQSQTTDKVRVLALDKNGNAISDCMDEFNVRLEQEEKDCDVLTTNSS